MPNVLSKMSKLLLYPVPPDSLPSKNGLCLCLWQVRTSRYNFDDVVELTDCHLIEEESFAVYKEAVKAAQEAELEFYDYIKHEGYLRYITIRRTRTGQQLLSFLTSSIEYQDKIEAIAKQF